MKEKNNIKYILLSLVCSVLIGCANSKTNEYHKITSSMTKGQVLKICGNPDFVGGMTISDWNAGELVDVDSFKDISGGMETDVYLPVFGYGIVSKELSGDALGMRTYRIRIKFLVVFSNDGNNIVAMTKYDSYYLLTVKN